MEDIYQIKIHYEKKEEQFDMMEEELIENSLSDFAKAQKKKIDDFAFYYKGTAIDYKVSNKNHVMEIFGEEKEEKVFHVFAFLISGSPKKKIKEPEKVEEKKAPEMNKIEEEKKPEENKEKEEVKQFEREKKYFDIICPECKTSAIIDIDENNYTLNILNCENFHHLSDIKYSYYDHFIPFYDINLKDESPENLNEIGKILAPSRDLYECKKCSTHLVYLTPQPDKTMNICTCGDIICYECSENHNEQGHIKKPIEMKNYHCFIHNKSFENYCLDCNCNICSECEKDKTHDKHTILKYGDFKPKQGEIKEFEEKIKNQKEKLLPDFINHIKEEFNKIINEVESYIKSYIAIEETLIRRYNKDKTLNFQLLRNLSNPKIFENSLFKNLEKFSNKNEGSTKKFAFLTKIYENIIKNKEEKLEYTTKKIKDNKISLKYSTKNTNNINKYVKLFDPIFVKNNKDKFSITINGKNEKELKDYYYNRSNEAKLVVILKEKGDEPVTNMSYMLNNCKNLTNVNFKNWKFSNINSMEAMFQLTNTKDILKDISSIESKHLKNVRAMFCKCINVENIPDLKKIFCNDNKIEDISMLFNGCKNLIKVDKLIEWQAPNLKKMEYLFNRCEKIEDIYLGTFNTEHVKSICGLFNGCTNLKRVRAKKNWKTSDLEDVSIMFQGCSNLDNAEFFGYLDKTLKVKDMSGLFSKCSKLKKSIPKLVTNDVEYMVGLFNECTSLDKIDASSWNMSNITDISGMFYKCNSLKSLTGVDNWNFDKEFKYENTFDQCPNIKADEFNNKLKTRYDQINKNKIGN